MKKQAVLLLLLILCISFAPAQEVTFPDYQDKYVNDFAGIFSQEQVSLLRALLSSVDSETTAEVSVATIPECVLTPSDYAYQLFTKWQIGKKDKNNGLLILYCKAENKIWTTTGYGLEGILPDSKLGRMLDDYYVPQRDSGNVTQGIITFTEQVAQVITENKEEVLSGQTSSKKSDEWKFIVFIILIFFLIPAILRGVFRKKIEQRKKSKQKPHGFWDALFWIWVGSSLGRSSGGVGGGGGGFGGGFGGGMSGGGGAGR